MIKPQRRSESLVVGGVGTTWYASIQDTSHAVRATPFNRLIDTERPKVSPAAPSEAVRLAVSVMSAQPETPHHRVAGAVARPRPPHHRTYGSVYCGSCEALEATVFIEQTEQAHGAQRTGRYGVVHV